MQRLLRMISLCVLLPYTVRTLNEGCRNGIVLCAALLELILKVEYITFEYNCPPNILSDHLR